MQKKSLIYTLFGVLFILALAFSNTNCTKSKLSNIHGRWKVVNFNYIPEENDTVPVYWEFFEAGYVTTNDPQSQEVDSTSFSLQSKVNKTYLYLGNKQFGNNGYFRWNVHKLDDKILVIVFDEGAGQKAMEFVKE